MTTKPYEKTKPILFNVYSNLIGYIKEVSARKDFPLGTESVLFVLGGIIRKEEISNVLRFIEEFVSRRSDLRDKFIVILKNQLNTRTPSVVRFQGAFNSKEVDVTEEYYRIRRDIRLHANIKEILKEKVYSENLNL